VDDNMKGNKKIPFLKIILIGVLFILIQSFLQQYDKVSVVFRQYIGYFTPLLYALFTAVFLEPIVKKIETHFGMKETERWPAVLITVGVFLLFIIGFIYIVIPEIIQSCKELYDKFPYIQEQIGKYLDKIFALLEKFEIELIGKDELQQTITSFVRRNLGKIRDFGFSFVLNMFWWTVAITKFFIGFFLGSLILLDPNYFVKTIHNILKIVFGKTLGDTILAFADRSRKFMIKYIGGRVVASLLVASIVLTVTLLAKVPYALLSSMLVLIGNLIPYVGSIFSGVVSIFLVLVSEPGKVIWMFVAICLAQFLDSWVIGPRIASKDFEIRSFWIILSILFGGSLFGPLGMIFAVPVLCAIREIYKKFLKKREENEDGNIL